MTFAPTQSIKLEKRKRKCIRNVKIKSFSSTSSQNTTRSKGTCWWMGLQCNSDDWLTAKLTSCPADYFTCLNGYSMLKIEKCKHTRHIKKDIFDCCEVVSGVDGMVLKHEKATTENGKLWMWAICFCFVMASSQLLTSLKHFYSFI